MPALETLNLALFKWMAAGYRPERHLLAAARWIGTYAILAVPFTLLLLWWRRPDSRERALLAVASGGIALAATEAIAAVTAHPRPFMVGLSPLYAYHAAEGSFPSAHASCMLAIAGTLLVGRAAAPWGGALAVLGLATAWARIYLGLHFPLDILGSALVATVTVAALHGRAGGWTRRTRRRLERFGGKMMGRTDATGNAGSGTRTI